MENDERGEVHPATFVTFISHDGEEKDGFVVGGGPDVWSVFNKDLAVEEVPDSHITAIKYNS